MTADVFDAEEIEGANLVLQNLAQQGANINEPNNEGRTPLHLVCCPSFAAPSEETSWQEVALKSLLNLSADLSLRDSSGQTPFDILIRGWEQEYITKDRCKRSPVTRRSQICARLMQIIVDHVLSVDVCGVGLIPWSTRLLFLALWLKDDTLSRSILEQQPDVEGPVGFVELSPIEGACLYGCSNSFFERLLEASSFRSNPTAVGVKLTMLLCENTEATNDWNLLQLISKGFDPNGNLPDGTTALMMAAREGKVSFVETLLRHGAQAWTKNHDGWNAAHYACFNGRLEVLYALHKTNVIWTDKASAYIFGRAIDGVEGRRRQNLSMLHLASGQGNSKVVEFLLSKHLIEDINCITDNGETAVHDASRSGMQENVSLLLEANADDSLLSKEDESPLHSAAKFGHVAVIQAFVARGCQTRIPNSAGMTPEMYARKYGHGEAANVLRNKAVKEGFSALGEVLVIAPSFALNLAPCADAYEPREGNILSRAASLETATLRRILRRMPKEMIPGLLNRRHRVLGTPLYAAIMNRQVDLRDNIDILLDAGADLEFDGSDHGTPLMGACAAGRLPAVKHLLAKGAKTSYIRGGEVFSVLTAAKLHPRVVRWLLVDRSMELRFLADK
ncbi:MAG: hypothetical protein Q9192_003296 [Flavoplaca navasiana]